MPDKVFGGVDIGGTKTAVVLSAEPPHILGRIEFPTHAEQPPEPTLQKIIAALKQLLAEQSLTSTNLVSIGISCGSPLDQVQGVIQQPPNLPTWIDVPIKALLEAEFSTLCFLENDANGGALAEHRYGAGRGMNHVVFLTMGTGIGAGLILDGRLYRGASLMAGEIGHVRLTEEGPTGYDRNGTVEGWASGGGMARLAAEKMRVSAVDGENIVLLHATNGHGEAPSAKEIWMTAQTGDPFANEIVKTTGERLGQALAILVDILNPDCIVVGGLAVRMGDALLEPARGVMKRETLPASARVCTVVPAALGEQIGDVAAICIAQEGVAKSVR